MAADRIKGQGRAVAACLTDFTVGHQSELNQRLESVTNTQHQAVTVIQQIHDCLFDALVFKGRLNELAGAVRLVTAGKSARQHNHLCLMDAVHKTVDRILNVCRLQVLKNLHISGAAGAFKCAGGIIFAVRSRKGRNKDARLCKHLRRLYKHTFAIGKRFHADIVIVRLGCKHLFQRLLPAINQRIQADRLAADTDHGFFRCVTQLYHVNHIAHHAGCAKSLNLNHDAAKGCVEKFTLIAAFRKGKSDFVAESHLTDGLHHTTATDCPCRAHQFYLGVVEHQIHHIVKRL